MSWTMYSWTERGRDGDLAGDENIAHSGPGLSNSAVRWQESQE